MANKIKTKKTQDKPLPERGSSDSEKAISPASPILDLQRTVGNQAMARLFDHDRQPPSQIGSAAHVPTPASQTCTCSKDSTEKCASCQAEDQRQRSSKEGGTTGESAPAIVQDVLSSTGEPLDEATRSFMASRFGKDFREVRVSADDNSAQAADVIRARAFTWGNHIVFGRNEYDPHSPSGLRLIAHELAHTGQQESGPASLQANLRVGSVSDPQEREADVAADAALHAQPVPQLNAGVPAVRRQPKDRDPWEWKGDSEGVYTTESGVKYTITRKFKPVTTSEETKVTPGAKFAKGFVTITWCRHGTSGDVEAGLDITNTLQQLIPQILATGNPQQVLQQAKLTPYVQAVILPSEKGPINFDIHADVSRQGVTGVGAGASVQTSVGRIGGSVDVDLPPGGRPSGSVTVTFTPGDTPKKKKVECETTTFEPIYECRKEEKTPPSKSTGRVPAPVPPRIRHLYFDYSKDIVTSPSTQYGKDRPEVVARNSATLDDLKKDLNEGFRVSLIAGYTSPEGPMDPKGKFEGNTKLSEERATAARDYIAAQLCSLRLPEACFVKEKDAVTLVGGGELHTKVVEGKEAEGKALAESAVPEFLEQEGSALSSTERQALEKKRSPLAQAEIVYPLLRRAEITLTRGMVETPVTVEDPGGTKTTTVDCPEYILIDAKAHFALNDALKGKKGP